MWQNSWALIHIKRKRSFLHKQNCQQKTASDLSVSYRVAGKWANEWGKVTDLCVQRKFKAHCLLPLCKWEVLGPCPAWRHENAKCRKWQACRNPCRHAEIKLAQATKGGRRNKQIQRSLGILQLLPSSPSQTHFHQDLWKIQPWWVCYKQKQEQKWGGKGSLGYESTTVHLKL